MMATIMKKDDPHTPSDPFHEQDRERHALRPALLTWSQDEARIQRARRQRVRQSRSIYIPPFPVREDPVQEDQVETPLRWSDDLPVGLKLLH